MDVAVCEGLSCVFSVPVAQGLVIQESEYPTISTIGLPWKRWAVGANCQRREVVPIGLVLLWPIHVLFEEVVILSICG